MRPYISRLSLVAGLFILSISVGVVTQQGGRLPLVPDQLGSTVGVYEFTWSPDGKSIAYISSQGGQPEVWTIPSAGGTPKRLTMTASSKRQPRWSNDGKWIAYIDSRGGQAGDIHVVSADGDIEFILNETSADEHDPHWSPDSRQLAFIQESEGQTAIAVADLDTRQVRRVVEASASNLQWSRDGHWIVFVSNPLLRTDDRRDNQDIFIVDAAGGNPRLLTSGTPRFREGGPSWAPDSRQIAFASDSSGFSNIFILDSENGSTRSLGSSMADQLSPKWSPDGRNIAFIQNDNSQFNVWVVPAQGGRPLRASELDGVSGGFEQESATPQGSYEWSPDGKRIAFTHSDPGRTSDLWVVTPGSGRPIQLTNSMPAELRSEARFIWPETTTYRSFDGTEVRALVYKPRGIKPKAGHPALLMFRDSLDGQNALSWNPFIQFFVSDGYVIFAPNIRGSSGRGKDFRQMVFEHGGDHDIRDAFIGLDKLSSEGLIDTQRLGVFGAGTGGFLATAALIQDEARFKAAVCMYGIMDAVTAASYPSMSEWTRYMIGSTPMANPLSFYERSLVNFVDKLRTPIIFLYAQNDTAAPFQQLQQFAVQAEVKGKWFDYRVFENEPRAWQQWRPNNLRQALEAMDAVFEKHVLGKDREIRLSRNR